MNIHRFLTGPLDVNCYLIVDESTGKAAVLDPGGLTPQLEAAIQKAGDSNVEQILLTHGHFDHIGGVAALQKKTGAKIFLHEADRDFPGESSLIFHGWLSAEKCQISPWIGCSRMEKLFLWARPSLQ